MSNPAAVAMAKRFEPILLLHPDEKFFPIDPKFYLERCALWRSEPPANNKQQWGEPPPTAFPRKPQLRKGQIAALQAEAGNGKSWIGETNGAGDSDFLVIEEPPSERPLDEDRFLQLAGWEPFLPANEVTATSENRNPTLDVATYNAALQGGKPWYYAEYLTNQELLRLVRRKRDDLFEVVNDVQRLSRPSLLVYHFFYALHEEALRGCEDAGGGGEFATFAGEWTSIGILINSAGTPLFIGLTSRNVGDPTSIPTQENRLSISVEPWKAADRVGDHPKIFVSRGTHGNYLTPGPHPLKPFTPGDIDLNQGTCAEIEKLDDVIPGGESTPFPGEDPDIGILLLKAIPTLGIGLFWAAAEGAWGSFGGFTEAMEPNRAPQDETGGPLFGLILKPVGAIVSEQASAQRTEEWQTEDPAPNQNPRYDFIVDRTTQLWWVPREGSRGYAGRWGPRVTNDIKARRSGMRCPDFALLFLEGIARL